MGVDFVAYRDMVKLDCLFDADGEPVDRVTGAPIEEEFVQVFVNDDFPGRADEFVNKAVYSYGDSSTCRGMAYGAYYHWRDALARLAGYPLGEYELHGNKRQTYCLSCWEGNTGPFSELIDFSDCEGVIGSAVSKKLAEDFCTFQAAADESTDERFKWRYAMMRALFEFAANNGCVRFT